MEKENPFELAGDQEPKDPIRMEFDLLVCELDEVKGLLTTVWGACQWGMEAQPEDSSDLFPGLVYSLEMAISKVSDIKTRLDRTCLRMGKGKGN